jgi:glycosyltransferase involved in cell wall biosynthesis
MPLLSVLIPTYNRPEYLQQALSSLVYLGKDLEVIIGNNGDSGPVNAAIAKSNIDKPISHLRNPAGSTYPDNLKILISKASGKWLTILHDDDFFTQESELIPELLTELDKTDFLFSDHWLADSKGIFLPRQTDENSKRYGRSLLSRGHINNLQLLAVKQAICLDCFFVKTDIAKKCEINTSLQCFADVLLLAQITSLTKSAWYLPNRLFSYRVNNKGLTSQGLLQDELLRVLLLTRRIFTEKSAQAALVERIRRQAYVALKYSVKMRNLDSFALSLKILISFF